MLSCFLLKYFRNEQPVDCGYRDESKHFYALSWLEVDFLCFVKRNKKLSLAKTIFSPEASRELFSCKVKQTERFRKKFFHLLQNAHHDRRDDLSEN